MFGIDKRKFVSRITFQLGGDQMHLHNQLSGHVGEVSLRLAPKRNRRNVSSNTLEAIGKYPQNYIHLYRISLSDVSSKFSNFL